MCILLILIWPAPLGVHSTIRGHQLPQNMHMPLAISVAASLLHVTVYTVQWFCTVATLYVVITI